MIDVDGLGGEMRVLIPKKNNSEKDGILDVRVDGNIDVKVKKY